MVRMNNDDDNNLINIDISNDNTINNKVTRHTVSDPKSHHDNIEQQE